jgi:hypothetical protein
MVAVGNSNNDEFSALSYQLQARASCEIILLFKASQPRHPHRANLQHISVCCCLQKAKKNIKNTTPHNIYATSAHEGRFNNE